MRKFLKIAAVIILFVIPFVVTASSFAWMEKVNREDTRKKEVEELQQKFSWWPTDAKPGPVEDKENGGYWWWPDRPGEVKHLWGNRGYCYVRKIIFDYKEEELPPPQPQEMRPSLLVRKIIKNVKIYFDYDKSDIRDDSVPILDGAVRALDKNPSADILLTGNCDIRGSEQYNDKLGKRRGEAVKQYMLDKGVAVDRIRIISRGKLDAIAHVTDLVGMQKDRNAQFMVAEVEEVMLPYTGQAPSPEAKEVEEGKYVEETKEEVTGEVKVSTREYVIKPGDSLWKIAQKEMGSGYRWKNLYEMNKGVIKDQNKLKAGTKIVIPVE